MNFKNLFFTLSLLWVCASCGGNDTPSTEPMLEKIEINPQVLQVPATGGTFNVQVTANHEWGSASADRWLSLTPQNSTQQQTTVKIKVEPNPVSEVRKSTITFMAGKARATLNVEQAAADLQNNPDAPKAPEGYKLVWNDEFNTGFELNNTDWTHEVQPSGWVNNELQNYVNGEYNGKRVTEIKNGKLLITAFNDNGKVYSGRVYAHVNKGWLYGYFEARIKLPKGKGTWPAFWMMPVNNDFSTNPWPKCGEIDIMEEVGVVPNEVSSSIHCQAYNHTINTQKTQKRNIGTAESEFHVYACEWTPDALKFFVDGDLLMTFENDGQKNINTWPFNKPFYLILNLAWGGMWGGMQGVDPSALPVTMEVDYVRVFQKK